MIANSCYLGSCEVENLRALNDQLNAKVVEQVNDTQELVMLNNFAQESNEYQFKKCLQNRMSDIASWRWVLEDLTKRLTEAAAALQHEHNALRVVIGRLQKEIDEHSRDASRPGVLSPLTDSVEEAIMQEYNYLREQKKKFERMILSLETQTNGIEKTKKKIEADVFNKERALCVEEACAKNTSGIQCRADCGRRKKKKRASPITRWENRCVALKTAGLRALSVAVVTRQEVRGARIQLSITAQAYASRVDSALRRRLNTNKVKLQDIYWQKEETMRDYQALLEEVTATEQNILETMDQERIVEARLIDRSKRPDGEHIKDEVDKQLREELGRLRNFNKQLRENHQRILILQTHLTDCMARIDCCAADILQVVHLDDERITSRLGEVTTGIPQPPQMPSGFPCTSCASQPLESPRSHQSLQSIKEEDEEEDEDDEPYPLDH